MVRDIPGFTTWYVPAKRSPSGMTADIFPLSPNILDVHVMLSGPAGAPGVVTRPVTGPEAQPASAVVVSASSTTAYPT
jgi:hypothetical protein